MICASCLRNLLKSSKCHAVIAGSSRKERGSIAYIMKTESFRSKDKITTAWEGLWWHPESGYFSSKAFDLTGLKQFKGSVRIFVKKNKYFNKGKNGRPNYLFSITASDSGEVSNIKADNTGENLTDRRFTYNEVQEIINKIVCEIGGSELEDKYHVVDYI